jgi:SAM-dependent methyltransferase
MTPRGAVHTLPTMTTISPEPTVDVQAAEEFAGRLLQLYTGATLTYLIDIGRRTGLLEAAARGPANSQELADRAGLAERYVREWLGAMTTGGILEYEPVTGRHWLPHEHTACLTGDGVDNLAPLAYLTVALAKHVPAVSDAFRSGGGVAYSAYLPELHDVMEALWGPVYDTLLVDQIVPLAPGLAQKLATGARAADVACGTGRALIALATAYPASTFTGFDLDSTAINHARTRASDLKLTNLRFETHDAATLTVTAEFDAVFVFNAIHDQTAPAAVLHRIHDALAPGGTLLMNEPRLSSNLDDNLDNPLAPFVYAISTLHCLTVSLAEGGAGLGAAFGEQTALQLLTDAGFGETAIHDAPGDPGNAVYITHKPE